jgi:GLPGLI family protein
MKNILLTSFLLLSCVVFAQYKINEGKIFYDISYKNLSPDMKRNEHMLPHDASFYFKGQKTRMEMGIAGMGKNTTIYDGNTKETVILLNLFGKKLALKKSDSEMVAFKKTIIPDSIKITSSVTLFPDTKKIAGYVCQKAMVKQIIGKDTFNNECWFSRDIAPYNTMQDPSLEGIPGILMQYSSNASGALMTLTVRMVSPIPMEDYLFEIPKEYQVVTEEELNKLIPVLQGQR